MNLTIEEIESPVGCTLLVQRVAHESHAAEEHAVVALEFKNCRERMMQMLRHRFPALNLSTPEENASPSINAQRLAKYFLGDLQVFAPIRVDPGGTSFQQRVWLQLQRIPAGETRTYGAIATLVGQPGAARAVGHANSLNPIALLIPCHRVIGKSGKLTGYAGGLQIKAWLLKHERGVQANFSQVES